jgi:hypothetical protein
MSLNPRKWHLFGLNPGERFCLSLSGDALVYTVAHDADSLVYVIDPAGQPLPAGSIYKLNGASYFVYLIEERKS